MTDAPTLPVSSPAGSDWPDAFAGRHPLAAAAAAILLLCAAPWVWLAGPQAVAILATAAVVVGVPHGAVDHRVARPLLQPRFGRAWFPIFTILYLGVAGVVLAGWWVAPAASLALFLLLSALHFGTEDAEGRGAAAVAARGGAPIALAILWHPDRTERFFAVLGATPDLFAALQLASWAWLAVAAAHLLAVPKRRDAAGEWVEIGTVVAVFAALPPTVAFAFYFLVLHSPRHMAELAARRSRRNAAFGWGWTVLAAVPLSLATAALGGGLFLALDGDLEQRFLRTVFWGLAALTVPHMILHALDRRAGSPALR